jgi:hypothetical protein
MAGLQYGIKEMLDLTMLDYATKAPIVQIDYATATTNEVAAERVDVRGGKGMPKRISWDHSKDSTLVVSVPEVDLKLLAWIFGDDTARETVRDIFKTEKVLVNTGTGQLSKTPVGAVKFYEVEDLRDFGAEVTGDVTGTDVVFTDVADGTEVYALYQYAAPTGAREIKLKANKFAKAVTMHGLGLGRAEHDQEDYPIHVDIHKARPQANVSFTMNGTEATNLEITFDMYPEVIEGQEEYMSYVFEA